MGKLNAAPRKSIPTSMVAKGKLSPGDAAKIRKKANAMLGRDYVKPDKDSAAGAAT